MLNIQHLPERSAEWKVTLKLILTIFSLLAEEFENTFAAHSIYM